MTTTLTLAGLRPTLHLNRPQRLYRLTLALALKAALVLALVPAAPPANATDAAAFAQAAVLFERAGHDDGALDANAERWAALAAAAPTDPVLRAYAGAATAMRARGTLLPWRKLSHAEDGLAQIDKALAQLAPAHDAPAHRGVPAALETRFVAASTFLALPKMFNRHDRGTQLLDGVLRHPLFEASPLPFKAAVWLRAGTEAAGASRPDEARRWLKLAAQSATPSATAAAAQLGAL